MPEDTVSSKGRITIPAEIRRKLGLRPGDRVDFVLRHSGQLELRATKSPLTALLGMPKRPGQRRLSVTDMEKAVLAAADAERCRIDSV